MDGDGGTAVFSAALFPVKDLASNDKLWRKEKRLSQQRTELLFVGC